MKRIFLAIVLWLLPLAAYAQTNQFSPRASVIAPVSGISANLSISSMAGNMIVLDNSANSVPEYFVLGTGSAVATVPSTSPSTTGYVVPAGAICSYDRGSQNNIALINDGSNTNIVITTGVAGPATPSGCVPGGTINGGMVTVPGVMLDSTGQAINTSVQAVTTAITDNSYSPGTLTAPNTTQIISYLVPDLPGTGTINSATPSATYSVALVGGRATTAFQINGLTASTATLIIEDSIDGGTHWNTSTGLGPTTASASLTADGSYSVATAGRTNIRLRVSSTGTGTITVSSLATNATRHLTLFGAPPVTPAASGAITNPSSAYTLTSTTTAYSAGQLIANNATASSVTNPSFSIANSAGGALIPRVRLSTNDTTATAWGGVTVQVDLWSATPTWTNGDRAAWSPATGVGSHLATYSCVMSAEFGDGAYASCGLAIGSAALVKLASGSTIYWSLQAVTASGTTGASKVFTLIPEVYN